MKLNELFDKEIISLTSGERLGEVFDIEIDESNGVIKNVIIKSRFCLSRMFSSRKYITINWNCIKVFGEEIVLVESDDYSSNQTLSTQISLPFK